MIRLGVNIDHVATIRQARRGAEPDPVAAAILATFAGADGITIHLREDRRHIQDRDVPRIRQAVTTRLNFEMASAPEIVAIAIATRPDEATLVPEKREEVTTEGGLDLFATAQATQKAVDALREANIIISLFIDPDLKQVDEAKRLGADAIEFQTASYSEAHTPETIQHELKLLQQASTHAKQLGLHVHMGHGLNYHNIAPIVAIPEVEELNIGHSIISRAVFTGLDQAVRDMKAMLRR